MGHGRFGCNYNAGSKLGKITISGVGGPTLKTFTRGKKLKKGRKGVKNTIATESFIRTWGWGLTITTPPVSGTASLNSASLNSDNDCSDCMGLQW